MKRVVFALTMFALLAAGRSTSSAQGIASDVMKDWVAQKDMMMKIAAEMPADKFGYKSTPPQRSYGEHVLHVAQVNMGLLKVLGAKAPAPAINFKATAKADVLRAMEQSFDYGTAALKEFSTDAQVLAQVMGPPFLGQSTRARIVYFLIAHSQDIYGQMAVYLRLNGAVPPASQQP